MSAEVFLYKTQPLYRIVSGDEEALQSMRTPRAKIEYRIMCLGDQYFADTLAISQIVEITESCLLILWREAREIGRKGGVEASSITNLSQDYKSSWSFFMFCHESIT